MIPQTRTDLFLAKITGEDVALPVPQTRFELYLANIAGESYELPAPNSRATLYLAKILGQNVVLPVPQTRSELYLAAIAGMSVQLPAAPTTREEWYLAKWAEDAGYVTITGNPVTFSAVAAKLKQLKIAFSPVQEGSGDPSPENERPIHGWTGVNVWDDPYYAGLIKWNQLFDFTQNSALWNSNGSTVRTWEDGVLTVSNGSTDSAYSYQILSVTEGHKYIIYAKAEGVKADPSASNPALSIYANTQLNKTWTCPAGSITTAKGIFTAPATEQPRMQMRPNKTTNSIIVYCFMLCDLTQMFGAGNEPETVEEFRALFPKDYYAYNAGTETTVGAVNGDPGWLVPVSFPDGETYYAGWVDPTTGDGLATWAADDMGSVQWALHSNTAARQAWSLLGAGSLIKAVSSLNAKINAISSEFKRGSYNDPWVPYMIAPPNSNGTGLVACVEPSKYADANEFKTAVTGVQLCYELAEPIPFHVDPQQINSLAGANTMWTDADTLTVEYRKDGNVSNAEALSLLLGGRYTPATGPEDVSDSEALSIITGR